MPCPTVSCVTDLKDERVVLYEVLYGAASSVVLPIRVEECGAKHYGQVMEVHLVLIRKPLHAETQVNTHQYMHTDIQKTTSLCFSPVEVVDKGL